MNTVQINAFLSVVVLILGALLLFFSGEKSVDVPWLPIMGFLAGSLFFAFASWRKAAAKPEVSGRKKERRDKKRRAQ